MILLKNEILYLQQPALTPSHAGWYCALKCFISPIVLCGKLDKAETYLSNMFQKCQMRYGECKKSIKVY